MAQFTGTGSLIFGGTEQKVYDCEFSGGPLILDRAFQITIENCYFTGAVGISQPVAFNGSEVVTVTNNVFNVSGSAIDGGGANSEVWDIANNTIFCNAGVVNMFCEQITLTANHIYSRLLSGLVVEITIPGDDYELVIANNILEGRVDIEGLNSEPWGVTVHDNVFLHPGNQHALVLNGVNRASVHHNTITMQVSDDDAYDAMNITGDGNMIDHNQIAYDSTDQMRYGINIAGGDDNIVVGNNLGAAADYGTAPIGDSGTGTILDYPSDATWGDNFVS